MEGILNRAADNRQKLEMIYMDGEGNMSQRVIRVVELRKDHVLAYCYARKQVRSFKKVNILSLYPVFSVFELGNKSLQYKG